ncbi:Gluconate transport-inducing protein, partial [Coemansia sp. RSA 2603]
MTETYHGFIDTAHDALLIFEACNSGFLPRVQRRFSDRERQTIRSGAVYVWDEEETGMRRWTDGRTWSPSRVHGCFLIYYELEGRRHQFVNKNNATSGRSSRNSPRSGQIEPSPFHTTYDSSPPNIMQKEQGLIKKALSLCTNDKRKLHLVCYYSREDVENGALMSPTNDSRFSGVQIFEDRYPEIGHGSGRSDRFAGGRSKNALASRQWNPTTPDSPGNTRDGPPAYVRTSMIIEKRSRSYRNEVFRYPSYGPYPGPVRHVNAPAPQPQHMYQQQPLLQQFGDDGSSTIDSISNTQPAVHSSMLPRPMPREFIDSASHIDPSQRHVPTRDQAGQRNQSQQYPYATQYDERTHTQDIRHGSTLRTPGEQSSLSTVSHSFPVEAWKSAPISSGSTFSKQEYDYRRQQQSTHVHSSHTSSHTAIPSGFMPTSSSGPSNSLSGVTASAHPV